MLELPPKPAIIIPKSEALVHPGAPDFRIHPAFLPGIMWARAPVNAGFRYLILQPVSVTASNFDVRINQINWFDGSSWQPTSNMTSNSAPSPLAAFATEAGASNGAAWQSYQNSITSAVGWDSVQTPLPTFSPAVYLSLDLGAGNGINPTQIRIAPQDTNRAMASFNLYGSNDALSMSTPASAVKTLLKSVTGLTTASWTSLTLKTFTIP